MSDPRQHDPATPSAEERSAAERRAAFDAIRARVLARRAVEGDPDAVAAAQALAAHYVSEDPQASPWDRIRGAVLEQRTMDAARAAAAERLLRGTDPATERLQALGIL
jgi:hypothetical protein